MEDQIINTEELKEIETTSVGNKLAVGLIIAGGVVETAAAGVFLYRGAKNIIAKIKAKRNDTYVEVESSDEIPETE